MVVGGGTVMWLCVGAGRWVTHKEGVLCSSHL